MDTISCVQLLHPVGHGSADCIHHGLQRLGGIKVAITDINDLEGQILGTSDPSMDRDLLVKILKDNPLGQSLEQTPIGIIRKA